MLDYDENFYLAQNPDVAEAVRRGEWASGLMHYAVLGRAEGRVAAPEVDEAWYRATYPLVAADIAAGKATAPAAHYHAIGRYRGYAPAPNWPRPADPAAPRSRFGGFWTDAGNALDLVEGRRELDRIDPEQADRLRKWITDGYVILPQMVPQPILDAAEQALDDAYHGRFPDLRFSITGRGRDGAWSEAALTQPAKALDLHWFSAAIRDLIFADPILAFLHLVFERRVLASQTLGFWRRSAQQGHQDTAYVNYSLANQFAASWIALEDVRPGAGELFYHVGSHRISEYVYGENFKGAEVLKALDPGLDLSVDYTRHLDLIRLQVEGLAMPAETFLARRGDVLIWSADLVHGGSAISPLHTRKSVVTHYCPREVVPVYFERRRPSSIVPYGDKAFYSSAKYR